MTWTLSGLEFFCRTIKSLNTSARFLSRPCRGQRSRRTGGSMFSEREREREGETTPILSHRSEEGGGGGHTMYCCWPLNASLTFDLVFIDTRCETSTAGDETERFNKKRWKLWFRSSHCRDTTGLLSSFQTTSITFRRKLSRATTSSPHCVLLNTNGL